MFPVPAVRGGAIPRMWQGLAEVFASRGHAVTIFSKTFPDQLPEEHVRGVNYLRWGGFEQSGALLKDLTRDFFYAVRAVGRLPAADVLITNDFWLPVFAVRKPKIGRVVINANRFPKGQYQLYRRVPRIAAASNAVRNAIVEQCPSLADRIRVFPNPIDTSILCPASTARACNEFKTLLFVGRLHPEKGVHLLASAFARLSPKHPDWRLVLVGPILKAEGGGGPDYERTLRTALDGLPVQIRPPEFELTRLAEVYRSADLFCYPSLAAKGESFGVAPLEAMACGLPVVVSALECFQDFITDRQTGRVFSHDGPDPAADLAVKLDELMSQSNLRSKIAQQATDSSSAFSYLSVGQKYLQDFSSLV